VKAALPAAALLTWIAEAATPAGGRPGPARVRALQTLLPVELVVRASTGPRH